ncbi:haloacid dehalogenase [Salipaludibacillus neizhouensis]|uniref:Haloacid dehalogenase n=1 Tax=Salipaludibacillus neizhouensis TaxID=885475 RepID=A0A3A9KCN9_9BACI|nr:HAD family hydrolase [Salipaludibacillus neizhouensis]RKL68520.1 haloacid dehalogenase [Salipaludibacillus neizhouensis]
MAFRLLALDIDGTLLKSNHRLTKDTKEAMDYVKSKGVYITLATGRSFFSAKKVAKSLKLEDPFLITHHGAFMANDVTEPIFERRISAEQVYQMVDILENYHCQLKVFHEKYAISNKTRVKQPLMAKVGMQMTDSLFYPIHYMESPSNRLIDHPISALNIQARFWNEKEQFDAFEELQDTVTGVKITYTGDGELNITNELASKENALLNLGKRLGIRPNEMVAVSSDHRDIGMISQAGLGVAMGHADSNLKETAEWVTRSNDQDGVSYMVKEVFRKQHKLEYN